MKKTISDVSFEILSKCPNNCIHCSSCSSMDRLDIFHLDEIKRIVDELKEFNVERICLSGGEPFLHPNLVDIVKYISSHDIICDVYSAGIIKDKLGVYSLNRSLLKTLKDNGLHRIMFNLQAINELVYDSIMKTVGQQKYVLQSIDNAIAENIETELHVVPMKLNYREIDNLLEYAHKHTIKQVSFLRLVKHGRALNNDIELDEEKELEISTYLKNLTSKYSNIRLGIPLTQGNIECACHAIKNKLYIKYDGCMYGCEAFKYINLCVEPPNVRNNSIAKIVNESEYFRKSEQILCGYINGRSNCPVQNYLRKGEVKDVTVE